MSRAILLPAVVFTIGCADATPFATDLAEGEVGESALAVNPTDPLACEGLDFGPVSSDHYKTYQWHLGCSLYGTSGHVHATGAWEYTLGHASLGFLDGGIVTFTGAAPGVHPALAGAFREHLSPSFGSLAFAQYQSKPFGHGIHTMGLAAAQMDQSGTVGICPNCSTLLGNIALAPTEYAPLLNGLIAGGAQAINISLGIDQNTYGTKVIEVLALAAKRDIVVVAAAGNWPKESGDADSTVQWPASASLLGVIAVAGTNPAAQPWDERMQYLTQAASRFGPEVAVGAPANSIYSSFYPGDWYGKGLVLSPDQQPPCGDNSPDGHLADDGYGLCSGTSMSTPIVTGIVGLVRSMNPLLPVAAVRAAIQTGATPVGASGFGAGIVNAQGAVEATLPKIHGSLVKNRLTPLFALYSASATDALYTTVPQYAVASIRDTGRRMYSSATPDVSSTPTPYVSRGSDPPVAGYASFPDGGGEVPRAAVYIFSAETNPFTNAKDLVPLYRMSYAAPHGGNPNHRDHTYTTERQGIEAYQALGYKLDGIEGYIFSKALPTAPNGAVRLLRRYNPTRDDHAIFPETQLAVMQAEGYTQTSGSDWLGYVYPNVDSDADGLVDGSEWLNKTDPFRPDSDCDGVADGVEVPLAALPTSDPLDGRCVFPVHDFDGDGKADIAWRNPSSGLSVFWHMDGTSLLSIDNVYPLVDGNWLVGGVGDFNGDGKADLMWRNPSSGSNVIWQMNGASVLSIGNVVPSLDANWVVGGVGDFNGDGNADLMWRNPSTGVNAIWTMNGATVLSGNYINPVPDPYWTVASVDDFNGDHRADLFWRNTSTGATAMWRMNDAAVVSSGYLPTVSAPWIVSR